jgi:hypothetical protein
MVSCMIGAFQALRIMSAEVDQAHDAVVAALATISMTQSGRADDEESAGTIPSENPHATALAARRL